METTLNNLPNSEDEVVKDLTSVPVSNSEIRIISNAIEKPDGTTKFS